MELSANCTVKILDELCTSKFGMVRENTEAEWFDMNRLIFVWSLIYVLQVLLELTLGIEYYREYMIVNKD